MLFISSGQLPLCALDNQRQQFLLFPQRTHQNHSAEAPEFILERKRSIGRSCGRERGPEHCFQGQGRSQSA
jgi:hypothetical protein